MIEIVRLTKLLNDDGYDDMDAKELCEKNKDFKQYYEINQEIVDLALKLRGRIKSQGQHAGGIIISSEPLSDVVPMTIKDGKAISQWTEGMSATQLSPVGLVKFDILGLKTMAYNVYTEELIKQSTGIIINWDECDPSCDEPYAGYEILPDGSKSTILFNDPAAIKMADEVKTEAVFQFDTHVAKGVLANGVKNFHDLVAYTALARPGPMECIPEYIARRDDPKKLWAKKEDPRVVEMLNDTHGIICYQEQLTNFWTKFGGLTVPEAEKARKAVAKKKTKEVTKLLPRIVESMVKNGFPNDPQPINEDGIYEDAKSNSAQGWSNKMVTFGRYAFNRCLGKDTLLEHAISGEVDVIDKWAGNKKELKLLSYDNCMNEFFIDDVVEFIDSGIQEVFEIEFNNGIKHQVTMQHKFLCNDNIMHTVEEIIENGFDIIQFDDN